ncbi:U4/U6.U5 small nuclear ribonucleoprotein 27 kDa protein yantar [Anticarsia gemmatalis]|uniref:U4/U6.U5 small nuclear ribonucleoprotein 27 kDa protein yantar n=1 Tax=Anticarsia gemmatalis TaxID=129554 RepID=UPI003F771392
MGRSPSPRRRDERRRDRERDRLDRLERDRDRDRDRERRRPRTRSRSRSLDRRRRTPDRRRSPSPRRRQRSRSPSPGPSTSFVKPKKTFGERPIVTPADLEGKTPEEQEMLKIMGFCGFDSTKGKKVEDNVEGDVHVVLKRKYRQYMNRKGGFNRPLDFVA